MTTQSSPFDRYRYVVGQEGGADFGGFFEAVGLDTGRPLLHRHAELVLKRGVVQGSAVFEWLACSRAKRPCGRRNVQVVLLDGSSRPLKRWLLSNAWIEKLAPQALPAQTTAVSLDTLSLKAERITPGI